MAALIPPPSGPFAFLNAFAPNVSYAFTGLKPGQVPLETLSKPCDNVVQHVLVQPESHVGFGEAHLPVQMVYFRDFHRSLLAKAGHATCLGLVNLANFGVLSSLSRALELPVDAGAVAALGLGALYVRTERVSGLMAAGALSALYAGARFLADSGAGVADFALMAAGFSALQAFSHVLEDVPYPYSTDNRFQPVKEWWGKSTFGQKIKYPTAAFSGAFLEWWASPRLFPYLFLEGLLRGGYRPDLNAAVGAMSAVFTHDSRFNFVMEKEGVPSGETRYRIQTR